MVSSHLSISQASTHPMAIRWTAILSGIVVALGMALTLYALGLGIGFLSVDVDAAGRFKSLGIFAGVWGALVPLIALFVGGWVASRASATADRSLGVLHGMVVWGGAALAFAWLLTGTISTAARGASTVVESAVSLGAKSLGVGAEHLSSVGGTVGDIAEQAADTFHIDSERALQTVNSKLREAGKPEIVPAQLEAAARDAVRHALAKGTFDQSIIMDAIVKNTQVSRTDAETVASSVEQQYDEARAQVEETGRTLGAKAEAVKAASIEQLRQTSRDVAHGMAKAFWGMFIALGSGLVAASAGGFFGSRKSAVQPT